MQSFNETHVQLMRSKSQLRFVGVAEVSQLARVLLPEEEIMACVKGWHGGSLSLMCATNERILLLPINRQHPVLLHFTYDEIQHIHAFNRAWHKHIILTLHRETVVFSSWRKAYAQDMFQFVQRHTAYKKEIMSTDEDIYKLPLRLQELSQHIRYAQRTTAKRI